MANKLKIFFAATFVLVWFSVSTFACSCFYATIKANNFAGQVFAMRKPKPNYKPEPNYQEPIPKATVKLWLRDDTHKNGYKLVAEVIADENGRFMLEDIKPDNYLLRVDASGFDGFATSLIISRNSRPK